MDILHEADPFLSKQIPDLNLESLPEDLPSKVEEMFQLMFQKNGIGLAASQVGLEYRVFIMGDTHNKFVCINPQILYKSDERVRIREGCLSYPGLNVSIDRSASIQVLFWDLLGQPQKMELNGIWARCFQHELDHLNGITFVKRAGKVSLQLAKAQRKKDLRRAHHG
jgi:peptide deformylase